MNLELIEKLNRKSQFHKTGLPNRILNSPNRMLYSIAISTLSRYFNLAVHTKARTFFDEGMNVVLPENVSTIIYRYGFFEEGLTTFILNYLKPGMVFLDIGAHFGFFSLLASTIVGENGQVHSFEPTKSTFEVLSANTKGKENIVLNNKAMWSQCTTFSFNDYGLVCSAYNSVYAARWIGESKATTYEVKALSVDSYVNDVGIAPDFIKIDAESAEYEILKGMEKTLAKHKPIITLEVGDMDVAGSLSSREIINYVLDKGYQAYEFKDGKIQNHLTQERYDYSNIFFVPAEEKN